MSEIPSLNSGTVDKLPSSKLSADDIADLFAKPDEGEVLDDQEGKRDKKVKEAPKDDESSDIEDSEDDIKLIEDDEEVEKLDLTKNEDEIEIDAPPRKKEILKKYPELFKDFPFMEKILYRDKQYSELFGSFDDAKDIADKAEVFNNFENQLLAGNTEDILKNVKETDSKAFDTIVDNYLISLYKVDKEAYHEVTGNINKRLIMEMFKEGKETENEDLQTAASIINEFIFGTKKFTAPTRRVNVDKDAETTKVEADRLAFTKERFETSRDELQTRIDNTLRATITEYIDPKSVMSAYVKKNAVSDALKMLSSSIARDGSTVKNLDKLWRAAFDAKFSRESLSKIQSFYLSKAKGSLKNAILKARAEALKDVSPKKEKEEVEVEEEKTPQKRNIVSGRPSQPKGKNEMKKGESVADFFARD